MKKIRVVYFTTVPLFPTNSGGALCCRNHVRRLGEDPRIDLIASSAGPLEHEAPNRAFANSVGARYIFLPFRSDPPPGPRSRLLPRLIARRWPFLHETTALNQSHIDGNFMDLVRTIKPDAIIVDYVPSASFVLSLYSAPVRRVTITLNREGAFYRDLRQTGRVPRDASASWIANRRISRFENWVYRKSHAVVALSADDLPRWPGPPPVRQVMPPAFDPSPQRWRYTGARSLFFVGNIAHYPNLLAVEWLSTKLAPELRSIGAEVQVRVMGATPQSVPIAWHHPNVAFLGVGNQEAVVHEFVRAGLFVAPIANAYGSKIKLLDCLSHATPFVASAEAMTGLPSLSGVPQISLGEPRAAAELIRDLLDQRGALVEISERLARHLAALIDTQRGSWGRFLDSVLAAS